MKSLHTILFVSLLSVAAVFGQDVKSSSTSKPAAPAESKTAKRGPIFRANKEQVTAAQTMLKRKGVYSGDATGKLDDDTRASLKSFQKENGLNPTGTLNRATLEKMGISLTNEQKAIPIPESSYAKASASGGSRSGRAVFRATKEQITEAQRRLKSGGMYSGEESGKLDDPTREGLRKYQEANGLKVTGTLNQVTLEKMGVALTDKQKGGGSDSPK